MILSGGYIEYIGIGSKTYYGVCPSYGSEVGSPLVFNTLRGKVETLRYQMISKMLAAYARVKHSSHERSVSSYDGNPCMLDKGGTPPRKPLDATA
jgi:hypothetical protein